MAKDFVDAPNVLRTIPSRHILGCLIITFVLGLTAGCASDEPPGASNRNYPQLKVVGILAGRYLRDHNNRPPKQRASFVKYLESVPEEWTGLGMSTVEEFLTSPRDGHDLVIITGENFGPSSPTGLPWVAYEQSGENGTKLVIDARGSITEISETELSQLFEKS